jgi:hypothetical protein
MDLREYYRNVRQKAAQMPSDWVVVVSEKTENGGKPGVRTEVGRAVAGQLIVDGKARLATAEEAETFYAEQRAAAERAVEEEKFGKVQLAVISEAEIENLRKRSTR